MDFNRPGLQLPPDLQVSSLLLSKETHEKEAEGGTAKEIGQMAKKTNEAIWSWANGWQ